MTDILSQLSTEAAAAWAQWLAARPDLIAAAVVMLVLVVVAMAAGRRGRAAAIELAEIKGRLAAMAEMGTQRDSERARNLEERIEALARQLGGTLDTVSERLGANVAEAGRRTSESLSTLNERLVLIDDARLSLAALSSEVGTLHGVLANKQARGAFGQVRMESIIRDALPAGTYAFQPTLSNGRRPDCVISLPNTAGLVVD